jgi:hypothetical protein
MATSSAGRYVGIDVSKDRLDVAVLGERECESVANTLEGIAHLVQQMQALQPELIVVEATGGYQPTGSGGRIVCGRVGRGGGQSCLSETICACLWSTRQDRQAGCQGAGRVWAEGGIQAV